MMRLLMSFLRSSGTSKPLDSRGRLFSAACACAACVGLALVSGGCGNASTIEAEPGSGRSIATVEPAPLWDLEHAEVLRWSSAEGFDLSQDRAIEASGAAVWGDLLLVTAEKYATVLVIDTAGGLEARAARLQVPPHTELEGITVDGESAYLCDEAHAAVYRIALDQLLASSMPGADQSSISPVPVEALALNGIDVARGKLGLEGIAVDRDSGQVFLLLERSSDQGGGCYSTVFRMRSDGGELDVDGPPVIISLDDCTWRLTALEVYDGALLALMSKFPGRRYHLVEIDLESATISELLDLTGLASRARAAGYGDNLEGLAVDRSGALWLLSDNAMTGTIDDPSPPVAEELTMLVRAPLAAESGGVE